MRVASGISEIVFALVFKYPCSFKEAFVVVLFSKDFSILISEFDFFHGLCKAFHISVQSRYPWQNGSFVFGSILRSGIVLVIIPTLQLSSPYAAEIHIVFSIVILENARINAVAILYRCLICSERTFWFITHRYANLKNILFIFYREIQVIFAICIRSIRCPHLSAGPRNIFYI